MIVKTQHAESNLRLENATLENHKKDSRKGVVSLVASTCIGLVGVASAGISAIAGYTSTHYAHSHFNTPKSYIKILGNRLIKNGIWWTFSQQEDPEYEKSKTAYFNRFKCVQAKRKLETELLGGFEKIKQREEILSGYRERLKDPKSEDWISKETIRDFLDSYEKGKIFYCKPKVKDRIGLELCKKINDDQRVINQASTINELAQRVRSGKDDLLIWLEEKPLNLARAVVLITVSLIAGCASYRLLKKAFSS